MVLHWVTSSTCMSVESKVTLMMLHLSAVLTVLYLALEIGSRVSSVKEKIILIINGEFNTFVASLPLHRVG